MSESTDLRCQSMHPIHGGEGCGKPAAYRYRALHWPPRLLCAQCAERFAAVPWMRKRLDRLDAGEGTS